MHKRYARKATISIWTLKLFYYFHKNPSTIFLPRPNFCFIYSSGSEHHFFCLVRIWHTITIQITNHSSILLDFFWQRNIFNIWKLSLSYQQRKPFKQRPLILSPLAAEVQHHYPTNTSPFCLKIIILTFLVLLQKYSF